MIPVTGVIALADAIGIYCDLSVYLFDMCWYKL